MSEATIDALEVGCKDREPMLGGEVNGILQ